MAVAAVATIVVLLATLATALAATVAIAATAATLRHQILGGNVAYRYYLYLEVEGLACHRVVEVHHYALLLNLADCTDHTIAVSVAHRHL